MVLIFHGSYFDGLLSTEQLTEISLAYPDDITKVTFIVAYYFWKDLINLYDVSLGVSFWHRNLERYNVSHSGLHSRRLNLINTQARIQTASCHSRWHCIPSTSPILPRKHSRDTTCIRIPYVFIFSIISAVLNYLTFCQCSNVEN